MARTALWAIGTGILGLGAGLLLGGSVGGVMAGGVSAVAGAYVGACQTGIVGVEQGLLDEASADKLVTATLAHLNKTSPDIVDPKVTSLATCRQSKTMEMFAGKPG
jgi:hypothetical protein